MHAQKYIKYILETRWILVNCTILNSWTSYADSSTTLSPFSNSYPWRQFQPIKYNDEDKQNE